MAGTAAKRKAADAQKKNGANNTDGTGDVQKHLELQKTAFEMQQLGKPGTITQAGIAKAAPNETINNGTVQVDQDTPPTTPNKKKKGLVWYSYELGAKDNHFTNAAEALRFKRDYGNIITGEHRFTTKKTFENHCARRLAQLNAKPDDNKPTDGKTNSGGDDLASKIAKLIADEKPVDRFHGYFKTTPHATVAVLFVHAMSAYGGDIWCFKPALKTSVLSKYALLCPPEDLTVRQALMNMDYGCLCDPKAKDKYKGKVTEYTPNGKKAPVRYDVHCAYTYFTIPHETINTTIEETAWLKNMSEKILTEVRAIMCTEAFKTVLEKTGNAQFVQKLYDPAKKTNLPKFLDTAIVTVEECNNYTDHVIQACANDIVTIMYDTRLSNRKYPDEILEDEFAGLEDEEVLQADLQEEKDE